MVGGVGVTAAFVLAVEKFLLLTNPFYIPTCSVSASVSCQAVMSSSAADVFGFPNPLIGIAGFAVVLTVGATLLAGARPTTWFWIGMQAGLTAGMVFVHWLISQSLYVIGALCPYCMVVWVVTIVGFWYVSLHNLASAATHLPRQLNTAVLLAQRFHTSVLVLWLSVIAMLVLRRFVLT